MISTYLGNMTIVLKFPLTNVASTNGRHRYRGKDLGTVGDGGVSGAIGLGATGGGIAVGEGNVAEVGVEGLARLEVPARWAERVMERLSDRLELGNYYGEW